MDTARRNITDAFLFARMSVHVDSRDRPSRNQFVALAVAHGWLHAGARVSSFHSSRIRAGACWALARTEMFDWQVIVVACVLLLASAYVGRRGWLRISSLAISKRNAPSCDKACGHCEGEGLVGPQFSPTSRSEEKSGHL